MKFYTSDLHFDHSNILNYENRPWRNVDEMNRGLIQRINEKVGLNDELYILGDLTLRRNSIKCKHVHLIIGNHDYFATAKYATYLFETISDYKEIYDNGTKLILCHYPILYWNGMEDKNTIHLYGHMHSRKGMQHPHKDAYNVGVDVNNCYPVTLEELLERRKNNAI